MFSLSSPALFLLPSFFSIPPFFFLPSDCNRTDSLKTIKNLVWKEARRLPLFTRLLDPQSYIFVSITQDTLSPQEFYDETKKLCDLHLFRCFLKLVEPEGNKEEKMLNTEIGLTRFIFIRAKIVLRLVVGLFIR